MYRFDGYITRTGPYGFARTSTGDKLYIAFRSLGIAPMAMDLHVTGEYQAYETPHYKNGATGTVTRISEYREVDENPFGAPGGGGLFSSHPFGQPLPAAGQADHQRIRRGTRRQKWPCKCR